MTPLQFISYVLLLYGALLIQYGRTDKCIYTVEFDFDRCTETKGVNFDNSSTVTTIPTTCDHKGLCGPLFNITLINLEPFTNATLNIFTQMLDHCCGKCKNNTIFETLLKTSDIQVSVHSDFVLPVHGRASDKQLRGYHFLPMMTVPTGYYFINKTDAAQIISNMITSVVGIWPFFVISIFLAFVSGFICWLLEKGSNSEQFPQSFPTGIMQGFWWSIVSMTTVGYGDKAPVTQWARLLAVVWMLIGITICSTFTASLTEAFATSKLQPVPVVAGRTIGAIKHRTYDASLISSNGGNIKTVENMTLYNSVNTLINMLLNGDIEGFLVDRYSYYYLQMHHKHLYEKIRQKTLRKELSYSYERTVYGMLIKNTSRYEFFKHYFDNNWLSYVACTEFMMNIKEEKPKDFKDFFSPDSDYFLPTVYITLGIIAIILAFGVLYELRRNGKSYPRCI